MRLALTANRAPQLSGANITQLKRSRSYVVCVTMRCSTSTTDEQIKQLEGRIRVWLRSDQRSTPWAEEGMLMWVGEVDESSNTMTIELCVELVRVNWQRPGQYLVPRSNLWRQVRVIMAELGITQVAPTQPIVIDSMPSLRNDDDDKEKTE